MGLMNKRSHADNSYDELFKKVEEQEVTNTRLQGEINGLRNDLEMLKQEKKTLGNNKSWRIMSLLLELQQ